MNDKERRYRVAQEAMVILGVITLLSFICRLWPIIILGLMGLIFGAVRLLFLKNKTEEAPSPIVPLLEEKTHEPDIKDVYSLAYSLILGQITSLVTGEYENAKWVWETTNPKKAIENGEDVYILLNGAGGYRRAKVKIIALRAVALEYATSPVDDVKKEADEDEEDDSRETDETNYPPINYDLIAFEWVDAHILELNTRLNEIVAEGKEHLLLAPEELPAKEAWDKLCTELLRADIPDVEMTEDGIKIYIKPQRQKGNETHEHMDE